MRRLNIKIMDKNIDPIIEFLLNSKTESVINSLAQNIIAEGIPENSNFQIMGIALLAVDDAKTMQNPSSSNPFYLSVFNRAKELINGEVRTTNNPL